MNPAKKKVVRVGGKGSKPKPRRPVGPPVPRPTLGISRPSGSSALSQYASALSNPFAPGAKGCRLPGPYATPTSTYSVTVPLGITTDASGNFDITALPHLLLSSYSTYGGSITGGATKTLPVSFDATYTTAIVQNCFCAATSTTDLAAKFENYRIVACGARFKPSVSYTNTSGRIYGAIYPSNDQAPGLLTVGATAGAVATGIGLPLGSDGHVSQTIVSLPKGFEISLAETLASGGKQFNMSPSSAMHTRFLASSALGYQQGELVTGSTGAPASITDPTFLSTDGFSNLTLKGEGLPASTLIGMMELIYHIEGTPFLGANIATTTLIPTGAPAVFALSGDVEQVIRLAQSIPVVRDVVAVGESFIRKGTSAAIETGFGRIKSILGW